LPPNIVACSPDQVIILDEVIWGLSYSQDIDCEICLQFLQGNILYICSYK
jgi:hypothetical protein